MTAATTPVSTAAGVRVVGYDAFRGLAVLCMIVDHLALVLGGPVELRLTVGRLAMPAFFLLAGHLARRPRLRHLWIALLGFALPLVVPWIDSPNVLVWWAWGVVVLWVWRWAGFELWPIVILALVVAANGWTQTEGTYDWFALVALMAVGSMLPATAFTWAAPAPRCVALLGRHPVSIYAGHLLALQTAVWLL
jgi:hypothetical protein